MPLADTDSLSLLEVDRAKDVEREKEKVLLERDTVADLVSEDVSEAEAESRMVADAVKRFVGVTEMDLERVNVSVPVGGNVMVVMV